MESEEEYKACTSVAHQQTMTPSKPTMPRYSKDNNQWKAYEMDHRAFMRHQHYEIQTLKMIDLNVPQMP